VVICTYSRPDLVAQVLATLAEQDAPKDTYEVLVIDNASPSDISAAVAPFTGIIPGLRCVREEHVGLSYARNRGYREAKGEYVGYVDDDCKLPKEWVSVALDIIQNVRPVMFGGPARAFYMTFKPRWFQDAYGSAVFAAEAGILGPGVSLSGMNMVIRKDALAAVGGFDPELGMTGMTMAYGEETALQGALRQRFGPGCVYYEPALYVYHLVRPEKMSIRWIMRRRYLGGLYGYRCGGVERPVTGSRFGLMLKCARVAAGFALDVVRGWMARDRSRYPFVQNYIWEHASYRLERLGQTMGQLEALGRR
jgi:glycosyltransferase involved in cell wall biosynthesis